MSEASELGILKRKVAELENDMSTIERGMSRAEEKLRDRFAMAAMSAIAGSGDSKALAEYAYRVADAMMEARQ